MRDTVPRSARSRGTFSRPLRRNSGMSARLIRKIPKALLYSSRALLWKLVLSRRDSVTIPTVHGLMTISTKDQFISKALYVRRQYGQDVIRMALELVRKHGKS